MCGIHCVISVGKAFKVDQSHLQRLSSRGPDYLGTVGVVVGPAFLTFTSTVLSLRGDLTPQPFADQGKERILCWNGEAWRIHGQLVAGNDSAKVFEHLRDASASPNDSQSAILDVLRSIEGPFAFVFLDASAQKLYYGRDRLGRRSLLTERDAATAARIFSSVSNASGPGSHWAEVEADGIYVLDLALGNTDDVKASDRFPTTVHPWLSGASSDFVSFDSCYCPVTPHGSLADPVQIAGIGCFNRVTTGDMPQLSLDSPGVVSLQQHLTDSLQLRVLNIPPPPARAGSGIHTRIAVLFSGGLDCTVLARLCHDLIPPEQAIDLLNVAFENPRVAAALQTRTKTSGSDVYEACPDRVTGRSSFAELRRVCPGRTWRFVAINIPYTESTAHRETIVSLMQPHNTEMDLSIAYALYFAARGVGIAYEQHADTPAASYQTPARVLLSGLGADELFGGYARHAVAFARSGYEGLTAELELDVSRLGKRNLGRDDRVMAHWGREVRFPYLDERLVGWAMARPAWEKCDFHSSGGADESGGDLEPGKRVLRLLALRLGMKGVAMEKKRAIQFGSRTAKMESGRTKGTTLIT